MKTFIIYGLTASILIAPLFGKAVAQEAVTDSAAIIETALNYGEGFYSGSAERMEKALCPDFLKLAPMRLPNSERYVLIQSTFTGLVEMSRARVGFVEESKRNLSVKVLQVNGDLAVARLNSSQFNDYLALARIDGAWKIVNVLWTYGPDSFNRRMVPGIREEEQQAPVEQSVRDYMEGLYTGDAERVGKAIHPRFSQATLVKMPTGRSIINRDGYDLIMEYSAAGMTKQDPSKWNFSIRMVDYMDGLAVSEIATPAGVTICLSGYLNGEWKVVSLLRKR